LRLKGVAISEDHRNKISLANLGKKQSEKTKTKRKESMSKLKWINKDGVSKRIEISDTEKFLNEGWNYGRAKWVEV
jgi:hypothetical protein